jgi:drug/metabolite transporter (DMT)-like permease
MWIILALSAMLMWGVSDVLYKASMNEESRFTIYVANSIIYGLFGIIYADITAFGFKFVFDFNVFLMILPLGMIRLISTSFYTKAMSYTYSSIASPIMSSTTVLTAPLGIIFLNEKLTIPQLICVIILGACIISIALIKKNSDTENNNLHHFRGVLFSIYYLLSVSTMYFLAKLYVNTYNSRTLVYYYSIGAIGSMISFLIFTGKWRNVKPSTVKNKIKALIAIGTNMGGYILYVSALEINSISTVQPIVFSYSIVVLILSKIFLKEYISVKQNIIIVIMIACITVLSGRT